MPPDYSLMSLGAEGAFRPAGSCPVASQWADGEYMAHQGDAGSFLVADARTRDGSASVRLALWRCVHCGMLLTGIAHADGDPAATREFTWLEDARAVVSLDRTTGSGPARPASGRRAGGEPGTGG
jgi:hypothetical protein